MPEYFDAKALVKETSTTTGTGAFTLAGAVSGFRRFQDAYSFGAVTGVPYVARMGSDYEVGLGILSAATTLQRTTVLESSNGGAAVNWGAGTKTIHVGYGGMPQQKIQQTGVARPTANDDNTDGFTIGSGWNWFYNYYICRDAGAPGVAGGADWLWVGSKWLHPAASSGFGAPQMGYEAHTLVYGDKVDVGNANVCWSFGIGNRAKIDFSLSLVRGFGYNTGNSAFTGSAQGFTLGGGVETYDATPDILFNGGDDLSEPLKMPAKSLWRIKGTVIAYCDADGVGSAWEVSAVVRRASGDPAFIGSPDVTMLEQDAGAAAWAVSLSIDTTNDAVQVNITGAAAKEIAWVFDFDVTQVRFP
jgi:hypothetical protein